MPSERTAREGRICRCRGRLPRTGSQVAFAFEQLLAKDKDLAGPVRATASMRLAQLYAEAGRWDDAMTIVESFGTDHPDFAQQYELDYVHGRCLAARALFSEARQAYEKVIRSSTGENTETAAKAQLMIAETFFHQRRYEDAYRAYMQVKCCTRTRNCRRLPCCKRANARNC